MHTILILVAGWIVLNVVVLGAIAGANRRGRRHTEAVSSWHRSQNRVTYSVNRQRRVDIGFASANACRLIRPRTIRVSAINWPTRN